MSTMSPEMARLALMAAAQELQRRGVINIAPQVIQETLGPQTDEELLDIVEELTGHHIPRVTTCPEHGHVAPSETFCDLYFNRLTNVIWVGPRGGGKTALSGALHGAKCRWNAGYKSTVAGAMERQSYRAYAEFLAFTKTLGDEIIESIKIRTKWGNDALTEVLGATIAQLNGPHPHLAQLDEADLVFMEVFQEFLNMAQGDDNYVAQQLLTSTRKKFNGLIQKLITQCDEAVRAGGISPWDVKIFCIFESLKNQPHCQKAPATEREAKLESLGWDPCSTCECHLVIHGKWTEGELKDKPRTFADVCRGRAFKSDGFISLTDAHKRFTQLSRQTWEAQCECLTPNIEGVVHKWFGLGVILGQWVPYPMFGPVRLSIDWGGQNPNVCLFFQEITVDVGIDADGRQILDEETEPVRVLKAGSHVQFDEIYKTSDQLPGEGDHADFAQVIFDRLNQWLDQGIRIPIEDWYCDPAGYISKKTVKKQHRRAIEESPDRFGWIEDPVFVSRPVPVAETVQEHIAEGEGHRLFVVEAMCPGTAEEYITYSWPEGRSERNKSEVPQKHSDHAMDATRYYLANLRIQRERMERTGGPEADPDQKIAERVQEKISSNVGTVRSGQGGGGGVSIDSPSTRVFR